MVADRQAARLIWQVQEEILALAPDNLRQRALFDQTRNEVRKLIEERWTLLEDAKGSLNRPLVGVLVVWLTIVFASFGYNAPRNLLVTITLILCAGSVAAALFLVVQLDQPFQGLVKVSSQPLQAALSQIEE